jgi:hypothetical protein
VPQRARSAKLVEPVGTEHLFSAATEGRNCRLTPLGRHYLPVAELRRICPTSVTGSTTFGLASGVFAEAGKGVRRRPRRPHSPVQLALWYSHSRL